ADTDPEKVAQQMAAARKALDKAFFAMVAGLIADGHTEADAIAELLVRFA
ncbi:metal-sensitive transcriptional regulator, partial [Salmonella enterica subsp. enterica]|nr:metal-sensitive transcriptional regulator [Salmonella enterica subsp. enterica serovar Cerro]